VQRTGRLDLEQKPSFLDGHELAGPISSNKMHPLKTKDEELATIKNNFKLMNTNWTSVYDGLTNSLNLQLCYAGQ